MARNLSRAGRRLASLNLLNDTQQYRKAQQRAVRAGQPTFTRALYLINQREKLSAAIAAKRAEAHNAMVMARNAELEAA